MSTTYRIYGHGDKREGVGFPTAESLAAYIRETIFSDDEGRYRYSETAFADVIILSRDGLAYGHFDIDRAEPATAADKKAYDRTKGVYIVAKSTLYGNPVRLTELGYIVRQRGLPIEREDFERILSAAGPTESFSPIAENRRYTRLCYSANGWRRPSGAAEETGTYYAANGFGHEEWLFNYEWCIDGKKYGFLQPFTRHLANYQGSTFSLVLYTKFRGNTFFVGTIDNVYVPYDDELAEAYSRMEAEGWISQMKADIAAVEGNVEALAGNVPNLVLNVRFDPADVVLYQDMIPFPPMSKAARAPKYVLLHDDGAVHPSPTPSKAAKKRSELQFLRAAQQGTLVDPAHARMQGKLYDWLCAQHGESAIGLEVDFVDLRRTLDGEVTFYELKTDTSSKRCIRNAIGQLFEYSIYSTQRRADRWIVVGDPEPTADDAAYLSYIRATYGLPIFYAKFNWKTGALEEPV